MFYHKFMCFMKNVVQLGFYSKLRARELSRKAKCNIEKSLTVIDLQTMKDDVLLLLFSFEARALMTYSWHLMFTLSYMCVFYLFS